MPESITSRDVLDELREFRRDTNDRLATLQTTLASLATSVAVEQTHRQNIIHKVDDHENRLRGLSRWRWLVAGGTAVALAVAGGPEVARFVVGG